MLSRIDKTGMTEMDVLCRFSGKKICIVGDIIADVFIFGRPYRLSREAPVVVIEHEEEKLFPGSAGNTINNLLALGAEVYPIGLVGNDITGERLMEYFGRFPLMRSGGIIRYDGETVTKTRIMAGDTHTSKQQVIRIDKDTKRSVTKEEQKKVLQRLEEYAGGMDAFIVSDYGHGLVDRKVLAAMKNHATKSVVVGDSRYNLKSFKGITLITPNESEAYELSGLPLSSDIEEVGQSILRVMDLSALLVTRGNRGMSLFLRSGETRHIPISGSNDVTDVTGAGDTVCAVITLALAGGADFYVAARMANEAAGIVVMKRGTATVSIEELSEVIG